VIDLWRLPGPHGIVRQIVAKLMAGNMICMRSEPDWESELRRAVADALLESYALLESCYDDGRDPDQMLAELCANSAALSTTAFWIHEIPSARAAAWSAAANRLADGQRGLPREKRLRIVIPLPIPISRGEPGLEILPDPVLSLSRMDLEVMARYLLSTRVEAPAILAILAAVAVELTQARVRATGCRELLDELAQWLRMPVECIGNPSQVMAFAASTGLSGPQVAELDLVLWRAQQAVLIGEIDARRLALITGARHCWQVPWDHQKSDASPVETVERVEFLQLGHLARQAYVALTPIDRVLGERLRLLKSARDDLCHLRFLSSLTIREVLKQPV
jgi:hypothetical protein